MASFVSTTTLSIDLIHKIRSNTTACSFDSIPWLGILTKQFSKTIVMTLQPGTSGIIKYKKLHRFK